MACAGYLYYLTSIIADSKWLELTLGGNQVPRNVSWPSIVVCLSAWIAILGAKHITRRPLAAVDLALLGLISIEPILANTKLLLGNDHQMSIHRYYYVTFQLTAVVAWLLEVIPLVRKRFGRIACSSIQVLAIGAGFVSIALPETNWFRYLPRAVSSYNNFDNSLQLAGMFPWLVLACWRVSAAHKPIGDFPYRRYMAVLLLAAVVGYSVRPSQMQDQNADFPFDKAYHWLRVNADPWDVVLTVPRKRINMDYLVIYTEQKSFLNYLGRRFETDAARDKFRRVFYSSLENGTMGSVSPKHLISLNGELYLLGEMLYDGLKQTRLDYILLEVGEQPASVIFDQLGTAVTAVYADETSVIMKVHRESLLHRFASASQP